MTTTQPITRFVAFLAMVLPLQAFAFGGPNLLLNKSYTASVAAHASHPDTNGVELTDGTEPTGINDSGWQGRENPGKHTFTIDMGASHVVGRFSASFFRYVTGSVETPGWVDFEYSSDGSTWKHACTVSQKGAAKDEVAIPYACSFPGVATRYLRLVVNPVYGKWVKIGEWAAYPTANIIQGVSYSASNSADGSYPDTNGSEATNGEYAAGIFDAKWQGRTSISSYEFTIDQGAATTFRGFTANFLKYTTGSVEPPTTVTFKTSTNGSSYTNACSVSTQGAGKDSLSLIYSCAAANDITARYLKVHVATNTTWSFLDEIGVHAAGVSTQVDLVSTSPRISATTLQPFDEGWDDNNWLTEYAYMKDVGVTQQFLQWTVDSKNQWTCYPTSLSGYTQVTSEDLVDQALRNAAGNGVDVFIGLQSNSDWFVNHANDAQWLEDEADIAIAVADELWDLYGQHSSFAGWYIPFEMDNGNFLTQTTWDRMVTYFTTVGDHLHSLTPGKPVIISPFFNTASGQSSSQWRTMWDYILENSSIDVIAVQDGVGVGHAAVNQIATWFQATKDAIYDAGRPDIQLWSVTETFTGSPAAPEATADIVDQMDEAFIWVSNVGSFSFNYYQSPQFVSATHYSNYQTYVETGSPP